MHGPSAGLSKHLGQPLQTDLPVLFSLPPSQNPLQNNRHTPPLSFNLFASALHLFSHISSIILANFSLLLLLLLVVIVTVAASPSSSSSPSQNPDLIASPTILAANDGDDDGARLLLQQAPAIVMSLCFLGLQSTQQPSYLCTMRRSTPCWTQLPISPPPVHTALKQGSYRVGYGVEKSGKRQCWQQWVS